jgi:ribonuclease HI
VNTALIQLFGRNGSSENAVIFSDSISAIQTIAEFDTLPSKRVTEIHSSIKLFKDLQKNIKFQWIPSYCSVIGNRIADYLAKKGHRSVRQLPYKLTFHTAKLRIKISIQITYQNIMPFKDRINPGTK